MKKYIKILATGIDVSMILKEVSVDPTHWEIDKRRQIVIPVHEHTETIHLIKEKLDPNSNNKDLRHTHLYEPAPVIKHYPETLKIVKSFFPVGLSRTYLIKLKAGKRVLPHYDGGDYYEIRNRYHLAVTGSYEYTVGDETEYIVPGMLFWFDNQQMHSAFNNTEEDRISVVFDVER